MDLSAALSNVRNNVDSNGDTWESAPEPCRADASVFVEEHQAADMSMRTWESAPAASSADAVFMMADAPGSFRSAGTQMPDSKSGSTPRTSLAAAANNQNVMAEPGECDLQQTTHGVSQSDHVKQPEIFVLRDNDSDAGSAEGCGHDCTKPATSSMAHPQTFNLGDGDSDPGSEQADRSDADAWWDQSPDGTKRDGETFAYEKFDLSPKQDGETSACEKFDLSPAGDQERSNPSVVCDSQDVWWTGSAPKSGNGNFTSGFPEKPPSDGQDPKACTSTRKLLQDQAEEEARHRKQRLDKAAAELAQFNRQWQEQLGQRRAAQAAAMSRAEGTAVCGGNPWARVCDLVDLNSRHPADNHRCDRGRMRELFLSLKASQPFTFT